MNKQNLSKTDETKKRICLLCRKSNCTCSKRNNVNSAYKRRVTDSNSSFSTSRTALRTLKVPSHTVNGKENIPPDSIGYKCNLPVVTGLQKTVKKSCTKLDSMCKFSEQSQKDSEVLSTDFGQEAYNCERKIIDPDLIFSRTTPENFWILKSSVPINQLTSGVENRGIWSAVSMFLANSIQLVVAESSSRLCYGIGQTTNFFRERSIFIATGVTNSICGLWKNLRYVHRFCKSITTRLVVAFKKVKEGANDVIMYCIICFRAITSKREVCTTVRNSDKPDNGLATSVNVHKKCCDELNIQMERVIKQLAAFGSEVQGLNEIMKSEIHDLKRAISTINSGLLMKEVRDERKTGNLIPLPPPPPPPPPPLPTPQPQQFTQNLKIVKNTNEKPPDKETFQMPIITVEALKSVKLKKTPHVDFKRAANSTQPLVSLEMLRSVKLRPSTATRFSKEKSPFKKTPQLWQSPVSQSSHPPRKLRTDLKMKSRRKDVHSNIGQAE